jgi:hypothetical protein
MTDAERALLLDVAHIHAANFKFIDVDYWSKQRLIGNIKIVEAEVKERLETERKSRE